MSEEMTAVADHQHDEIPKGLSRWLFTTITRTSVLYTCGFHS